MKRLIGIDFDNTIACYNRLFYEEGISSALIEKEILAEKKIIRDFIRQRHGDIAWQKLQGRVYGPGMGKAVLIEGVKDFIKLSHALGDKVVIISHKTEFANFDQSETNLRKAALDWMQKHEFFDKKSNLLCIEDVFFETTRAEKINRINQLCCDFFIDDLEEVLLDKGLKDRVSRILFQRDGMDSKHRLKAFSSWAEIAFFVNGVDSIPVNTMGELFKNTLGTVIQNMTGLNGGRNSRVLKVQTQDNRIFVAKQYFESSLDSRDRMSTEINAIKLLQNHKVLCIPKLVADDREALTAILEYIPGKPVTKPTSSHIDQVIAFLKKLKPIGLKTGTSIQIPKASEAFFSANEIIKNLKERFTRLQKNQTINPHQKSLDKFLTQKICPEISRAIDNCSSVFKQYNLSMDASITNKEKTLSPSDFGFHNAIQKDDGQLIFFDFEYFGWDDPAKLICDFILHPGMSLTDDNKKYFCKKSVSVFEENSHLSFRILAYYPLFLLKWCLIVLNEFMNTEQPRRIFANGENMFKGPILARQLNLSKQIFSKRELNYEKLHAYFS